VHQRLTSHSHSFKQRGLDWPVFLLNCRSARVCSRRIALFPRRQAVSRFTGTPAGKLKVNVDGKKPRSLYLSAPGCAGKSRGGACAVENRSIIFRQDQRRFPEDGVPFFVANVHRLQTPHSTPLHGSQYPNIFRAKTDCGLKSWSTKIFPRHGASS